MDLTTMIKQLYAVDTLEGYTDEDISYLKTMYASLPTVLEEFYRTAGKTPAIHLVQDIWMKPEHYRDRAWLKEDDSHFILLNENQGVCRAGIRKEDMALPDPPVYVTMDDEDWELCASTTSEFLAATLTYESVFAFEYWSEEFFWLSEEELELIQSRLTRLPFAMQNWMDATITCYNNAPDNLVVVMDMEGEYQMFFGGVTEEAYKKLQSILGDMGEPV